MLRAMGQVAHGWPGLLRRVGAYDLSRLIGRGGTASVYEAVRASDGASAAVKILHPHLVRDGVWAARFLREARTLAQIAHPNIVGVLEAGDVDGMPYLVMSLVEGEDLSEHLRRLHPMPLHRIADCILPVIDAVATAHEAGIVHRDLKPSNIRLQRGEDGELVPKVLDFGISKGREAAESADLTRTGEALGTLSYMAPEQVYSARHADVRSDIYALGVILYECATARRPFRGQSAYELMHDIVTAPVVRPSTMRRDLPEGFDAVVLRAMARDPAERFASARELGGALSQLSPRQERDTGVFARRAAPADTRVLADGSLFCQLGSSRMHMTEFGNGVVRHTCAGRLPAEFCSIVTEQGDEQIEKFGRVVFMVDGFANTVSTEFREQITQWFRGRRGVAVAHILMRSKFLDMAISVTNMLTGSPVLRPYTGALQWEAVGRSEAPGFCRLKEFPVE